MKHRLLPLILLLLAILPASGCSAGGNNEEASAPDIILRYAENQPEDYPTTQAAYAFADMVSERTYGKVQINIYPNGELGGERSVIEQMVCGGIDMSRVSLSQLAEYQPGLNILQLPYLYEDSSHMWRVLDSSIGDKFLNSLGAVNLIGLSWYDGGVRSIYSREKYETLSDLAGQRIRVQESAFMSELISLLGGIPRPLSYGQVYMALRIGDIDAAENNCPSYASQKHYEVAPYVLLDEHSRIPELQIIGKSVMEELEALNPDYPEIIHDCARESALIERALWKEEEAASLEAMLGAGVTVTELSEEEHEKFREAVMPLYENYQQMPILREIMDS